MTIKYLCKSWTEVSLLFLQVRDPFLETVKKPAKVTSYL